VAASSVKPVATLRLQGTKGRFKIRVGDHRRAMGRLADGKMIWVWVGTYSDYDRLTGS
jgi:hypothetical protein